MNLLPLILTVLLAPACATAGALFEEQRDFDPAELKEDVETYYAFGQHRAGSTGEAATADWLHSRLEGLGFEVSRHPFTLPQYELESSSLKLGDEELDTFPYWLPPLNSNNQVTAPLAWLDAKDTAPAIPAGRIVIVQHSIQELIHGLSATIAQVEQYGASGLVAISPSPLSEPWAVNAAPPYLDQPLPFPVVLVARRHSDRLKAAAEAGASATLAIRGKPLAAAQSSSVLGVRLAGPRWVVISTPFSGWYGAAAERGSGVALWLALAAHMATETAAGKSGFSIAMVANGAHEFDFRGARNMLTAGVLPAPAETALWIHLGAMIGAVEWRKTDSGLERVSSPVHVRVQATDTMLPWVEPAFGHLPAARFDTASALGELRDVREAGYRAVGLIEGGANMYFHTTMDRPDSVEGANLAVIAKALANLIKALEIEAESPGNH